MNLELIIVGNELLQGKIQDLNGSWLASFLIGKPIKLTRISIVEDDKNKIQKALFRAQDENDIVVFSGGLGPTQDDITKSTLADFYKLEIKDNAEALELVGKIFQRQGRQYDKKNYYYHTLPQGFSSLNNPTGSAPGLSYEANNTKVFALPGVPHEFYSMFEYSIYPGLISESELCPMLFTIKTVGIPEQKIFSELCPTLWKELSSYGQVSSLPQTMNVDIGITLSPATREAHLEAVTSIKSHLEESNLAPHIWHFGNESLEEVIVTLAREKNISFGFAESCTGGLNGDRITNIAGSSSCFMGSAVTYSNEAKMQMLSVDEDTLKNHGAVSTQTAQEMAKGALNALACDIAISTTGIAGPGGGSTEKPVGTIGIAFATKSGVESSSLYHLKGDRKLLKKRFSQKALFTLLEVIREY